MPPLLFQQIQKVQNMNDSLNWLRPLNRNQNIPRLIHKQSNIKRQLKVHTRLTRPISTTPMGHTATDQVQQMGTTLPKWVPTSKTRLISKNFETHHIHNWVSSKAAFVSEPGNLFVFIICFRFPHIGNSTTPQADLFPGGFTVRKGTKLLGGFRLIWSSRPHRCTYAANTAGERAIEHNRKNSSKNKSF